MQVLHLPQKFERPSFWNFLTYGIKNHGAGVSFNAMFFTLKSIKEHQVVQKLLGGTHTYRRTENMVIL
jgi:hypothetical protein